MMQQIDKTHTEDQPFGPPQALDAGRQGSAFGTMLLALYPVIAAIAVAVAGLAVAAPK